MWSHLQKCDSEKNHTSLHSKSHLGLHTRGSSFSRSSFSRGLHFRGLRFLGGSSFSRSLVFGLRSSFSRHPSFIQCLPAADGEGNYDSLNNTWGSKWVNHTQPAANHCDTKKPAKARTDFRTRKVYWFSFQNSNNKLWVVNLSLEQNNTINSKCDSTHHYQNHTFHITYYHA